VATFYAARSEIITPLPWLTFALPFSQPKARHISRRQGKSRVQIPDTDMAMKNPSQTMTWNTHQLKSHVQILHTEPCPKNRQSRVQNLDTNLVREPLSKPVKEEEDARARDFDFDRFFAELLQALGFAANAALPAWWQGWPARVHVRRWRDDLGLSEDRILEVAAETRRDHPNPPDGPKALDRFMERAAQRDAQTAAAEAKPQRPKRSRKADLTPRPSADDLAAFYADLVNSDRYLPVSTISNTTRDAMLVRGLVTPERLRMRGVR
jgi:hypothetical protein